ncbi:MAG: hydrogenase maturation nickel metallochaperone HypA [Eubacterium sp.]|nr:hydrogenase maturation nickel metallochaperone HypA [Eubacterium sp.]
MVKLVDSALETFDHGKYEGRVSKMVVSVGEMTGVLPEYLYKYYPQTVKGTILEGAELEVVSVPVETECDGCGNTYHPMKNNGYTCPFCGNKNGRVIAGRDVVLERLEIN